MAAQYAALFRRIQDTIIELGNGAYDDEEIIGVTEELLTHIPDGLLSEIFTIKSNADILFQAAGIMLLLAKRKMLAARDAGSVNTVELLRKIVHLCRPDPTKEPKFFDENYNFKPTGSKTKAALRTYEE